MIFSANTDYSVTIGSSGLEGLTDVDVGTEGWDEVVHNFIDKVKIICGSHEAMAKRIDENSEKFRNLFKDIAVRTVMPEDLRTAQSALTLLTEKLVGATESGEPIKITSSDKSVLASAGIEQREDGELYDSKFKLGEWGRGKSMAAIRGPMTFKKTIGEFGWERHAPGIADDFVEAVRKTDDRRLNTSITRHFKDMTRGVASVREKGAIKTNKKVVWNQMVNLLSIRSDLIKFIYKQLNTLLRYAHEDANGMAVAQSSDQKSYM